VSLGHLALRFSRGRIQVLEAQRPESSRLFVHVSGGEIPKDRPIDGVDQIDSFLGKQERSNRRIPGSCG
jgi:hypothetical protein